MYLVSLTQGKCLLRVWERPKPSKRGFWQISKEQYSPGCLLRVWERQKPSKKGFWKISKEQYLPECLFRVWERQNPLRGDSGKYQKNRYSPGCGFDDRKHTNINTYKDIEVDLWNCTTKGFSSSLNSSENRNSYTADGF